MKSLTLILKLSLTSILEAVSPIINIPLSLAQQLYDCWVESVNKQVEDMQNDYVKMLMEDELLAKAFQEQEFEYKQPDLREIMDMELAMLLYKQNQVSTLFSEVSRKNISTKQKESKNIFISISVM